MDSVEARARRNHLKTCSSIVIGCLVAVSIQVIFFSPISPQVLDFPLESSVFPVQSNGKLQEVIRLGEGLLDKPEDIAIDKDGILYTATRDGWIRRLHKNGTWESWWHVESEGLLGLTVTQAGDVIVCDAENGLLKVNEDGVEVLVSHFNGSKFRLADDVIESSDGTLYFSDASTKFSLNEWHLDVLEARPHGRLLKYNPRTKETSVVLDKLAFANGVALSADQDFLVVCETWKFRCLKYWLKGDTKGETEVFIDNLPGTPDNINLAPDGSFWIAMLQAHLASQADNMWFVITDSLMKILNANTTIAISDGAPYMVEKAKFKWNAEDKWKANLDNAAKKILYKTLDKNMFNKIKMCMITKDIWEKLTQLCA